MNTTDHTDQSEPIEPRSLEAFANLLASGMSQAEAFRETHPHSLKWKSKTVWEKASRIAANDKVKARVKWIQEQAVSDRILSLTERKEMLSQAARDCYKGLGQFIRIDKAGNQTILVDDKSSKSLALKSVKTRRVVDKNGCESTVVDLEARDFLGYVQELNALDQGSKHQVTGQFVLSSDPELKKAL
jgi:hypothetical protein